MSWIDGLRYQLRSLLRPRVYERELDEETRHHLELDMLDADSPNDRDTRLAARRRFGNIGYANEERRMISGLALVDSARQDVVFAWRVLRRRSAFAAVTVTTLALGIGAATSIYSVTDAVLFRPLDFREPDRLMAVWMTRPKWKTIPGLGDRWDRGTIALQGYRDWRSTQTSFEDVAIWSREMAVVSDRDVPEELGIIRASASLLTVLGVQPELGAGFRAEDDVVGGAPVALVSHETWMSRLGGDPHAVGRTIRIDSVTYTIIGVLRPGVSLERTGTPPSYWILAGQNAAAARERGSFSFNAVGRLKASASMTAATIETGRILRAAADDQRVSGVHLAALRDDQTRLVRQPLLILLAASAVLLLIACLNVATLLLGEAASRDVELKTRTALGAGRLRLLRQLLTESIMLGSMGAALGGALAYGATKLILRWAPPSIPGLSGVHVDVGALGLSLVVAVATGLVFGLAPALSLVRPGGRLSGRETHARARGQRTLIACEVALSMMLLVPAGLLVRSFENMSAVGFRASELLVVHVRIPPLQSSDSVRMRALYQDLLVRVRTLPGVTGASATTIPPFTPGTSSSSFEVEGRPPAQSGTGAQAHRRVTSPDYFAVAGIPIIEGRSYSDADNGDAAPVVVVSHALARREWPGETAVGKRIKFLERSRTVIGVTADIETARPTAETPEIIYAPIAQLFRGGPPSLLVRTRAGVSETVAEIRNALRDVAPDVVVTRADEMRDLVSAALADDRLRTMLITIFASIAALLAAVGTYGVAATTAARRTREMAIRVAVGASAGSIARLIVGGAAIGVAAGALVGGLLARAGARVLSPYLYGVGSADPASYASVVGVLAVITVLSTWIPARRATQVPVVETLRRE